VDYFGFSGDGHYGRMNITTSTYYATGKTDRHPLAQREQDIDAFFHATELSRDFDWFRLRGSFLYASGDKILLMEKPRASMPYSRTPSLQGPTPAFSSVRIFL